jgi:hypothetical protein
MAARWQAMRTHHRFSKEAGIKVRVRVRVSMTHHRFGKEAGKQAGVGLD